MMLFLKFLSILSKSDKKSRFQRNICTFFRNVDLSPIFLIKVFGKNTKIFSDILVVELTDTLREGEIRDILTAKDIISTFIGFAVKDGLGVILNCILIYGFSLEILFRVMQSAE